MSRFRSFNDFLSNLIGHSVSLMREGGVNCQSTHAGIRGRSGRKQYNRQRPHSSLSGLTPYEFIKEQQNKNLTKEETVNLKLAQTIGVRSGYVSRISMRKQGQKIVLKFYHLVSWFPA